MGVERKPREARPRFVTMRQSSKHKLVHIRRTGVVSSSAAIERCNSQEVERTLTNPRVAVKVDGRSAEVENRTDPKGRGGSSRNEINIYWLSRLGSWSFPARLPRLA